MAVGSFLSLSVNLSHLEMVLSGEMETMFGPVPE
jgi:hypothetical protein